MRSSIYQAKKHQFWSAGQFDLMEDGHQAQEMQKWAFFFGFEILDSEYNLHAKFL